MNRQRVARAYEIIAEGYAELARAFADEQPVAGVDSPPAPAPAPTIADIERVAGAPLEPLDSYARVNDRAASVAKFESCPKHGKPWKPSKYPGKEAYCPSSSDEPKWSNDRGYCAVTPSNAAQYAREHGMAA